MNKLKKIGLSIPILVVALLLASNALAEVKKATLIKEERKVVVTVNSAEAQFYFSHGYVLMTNNVSKAPVTELGGTNPNVESRFFCIGGICKYYLRQTMKTATTTLCSFPNPITTATTTLEAFDYQITTGTATATTIVLNASTGAYATSTATNIYATANSVASTALDTWSWSNNSASVDTGEISPNEHVLLSVEQTVVGGITYGGACQAIFRTMPR